MCRNPSESEAIFDKSANDKGQCCPYRRNPSESEAIFDLNIEKINGLRTSRNPSESEAIFDHL